MPPATNVLEIIGAPRAVRERVGDGPPVGRPGDSEPWNLSIDGGTILGAEFDDDGFDKVHGDTAQGYLGGDRDAVEFTGKIEDGEDGIYAPDWATLRLNGEVIQEGATGDAASTATPTDAGNTQSTSTTDAPLVGWLLDGDGSRRNLLALAAAAVVAIGAVVFGGGD
ncbi:MULTISPECIES: hypothetical protein [unclassified Haloferax]|uniref:hypothetical protein n=1 Tax=unclassified Haloferax TaxID=2625095 RepID=UPI002876D55A|nr:MULTISPECIES: hypothetical protein [unclassified Haloferax]MDS0243958.1 hypothetical protein [Haloferax sp. S2CR25]MDS0447079.1 hypothetical protein [Haloferax sp. S2CR25-2]